MNDAGPTREGPWPGLSGLSGVLDETVVHGVSPLHADVRVEYAPGTAVSRYVVLHEVGAGGMGVVYAAFDPQLNRKIALKILRPRSTHRHHGVDQAVTRLMREAQAIARLSHPNVVSVYDVGRERDAVFVAMEFIEGSTLTRWLEDASRSQAEICRVFALAGRGLAAAHEAGLVHRDFKPDNVLVSPDGRVRVLDFGLARADPSHAAHTSFVSHVSQASEISFEEDVDPYDSSSPVPRARDLGESDVLSSPLTLDDTVVGTPRYMAPEQHTGVGVDARSDQFSFCVALFSALFRRNPFPASHLQDLVVLKQEGKIADIPPDAGVPVWLEDLVMRGLAPRPAERWPSMDEIVGALEQDPEARRRRWLGLGAGALALVVVTAAVGHQLGGGEALCQDGASHVASLWDDARRERIEQAILDTQLPYAEHTWVEVERRIDEDLDRWVDTYRDTCEATRVRGEQSGELLDLRMDCMQEHLSEVRAVLDVLDVADPAVVQRAVSIVSRLPGLEHCADGERLRTRLPLPEDADQRKRIQDARQKLRDAAALRAVARIDDARRLAEDVLAQAESIGYEPLRVEALVEVGVVLEQAGDYDESEARLREGIWAALRIGHDKIAAHAASQLVSVVGDRLARYDEGLTWHEQSAALQDRVGETRSARASLLNNVGNVLHRKGDNEQAMASYEQAIELRRSLVGADDPVVAATRINLGNAQLALGQYEAALASYRDAQVVLERTLGPGHPQIAMAVASVGIAYNEMGRDTEALVQHRKALPQFEAWLGPDHLFVATTISNIGVALRGLGRLEEAEAEFRKAQAVFETSLGPDHPEVARCLVNLGIVRSKQGFYDEALRLQERALELRQRRYDEDDDNVVASRAAIAELWRLRGDPQAAVATLEGLAQRAQTIDLDAALRGEIHFLLAKARWDAGQLDARVRADLERGRVFLREVGVRGDKVADELDQWERRHMVDDRPRAGDGSVLPMAPASEGEP